MRSLSYKQYAAFVYATAFHANIAWAAAPGDAFLEFIFTTSEKQFRFCRLFVLLVKGQTIWTHLCAMVCRKRNSKNSQSLEKIKHSRAHILWRGKHRQSMPTFHPSIALTISIAALQSRFTAWLFCIAGKEITMPRAPNQ